MTRLPGMPDKPSLVVRAVDVRTDYTTHYCPKCGPVDKVERLGIVWLCGECGAMVTTLVRHDPHKGR